MSEAYLRAPYEGLARQHQAVSFGMWAFLASEVLLFSGLFAGYSVYRLAHSAVFLAAGRETDIVFGTVNTAVLMTSSLSIAIAVRAARTGRESLARGLIVVTVALGFVFLLLKGLEYREDLEKHLFPGPHFALGAPGAALFFSFYWVMTAIHALHVSGGLAALVRLLVASAQDRKWLSGSGSTEATALYWHLVDVIWIVLFPLLYLAGRSSHG